MADTQKCAWCHEVKPLTAFWVDRRRKSPIPGRDNVCSDCRNARRYERDGRYDPVITKGLKLKPNGLYPHYWERFED